jgi:DNA-binding HxlR family transcriptional regulator
MGKKSTDLCPVKIAVDVVGGKWKPMILYALRTGTKRFSELRREIPEATQQMLTQQLRQLEADGIISRKVYPVVPPKVEYTLTEMGWGLVPIFDLLERWGERVIAHKDKTRPPSSRPAQRTGERPRPIASE